MIEVVASRLLKIGKVDSVINMCERIKIPKPNLHRIPARKCFTHFLLPFLPFLTTYYQNRWEQDNRSFQDILTRLVLNTYHNYRSAIIEPNACYKLIYLPSDHVSLHKGVKRGLQCRDLPMPIWKMS